MRSLVSVTGSYSKVELYLQSYTQSYGVTRAPLHGISCKHNINP